MIATRLFIYSLTLAVLSGGIATVAYGAPPATPIPIPGSASDPTAITAAAAMLNAGAQKELADIAAMVGRSTAALNYANAERQYASILYLEDLRRMLNQEYDEILRQQSRLLRFINEIRNQETLVERIRLGRTDAMAFSAMLRLLSGSSEFAPIREALIRKVEPLSKENFIPNDDETGLVIPARAYPGGDVRKLLLFVKKNNYSFEPLEDAHWIVMDALSTISTDAANRILRAEQQIQAARAARVVELFSKPN